MPTIDSGKPKPFLTASVRAIEAAAAAAAAQKPAPDLRVYGPPLGHNVPYPLCNAGQVISTPQQNKLPPPLSMPMFIKRADSESSKHLAYMEKIRRDTDSEEAITLSDTVTALRADILCQGEVSTPVVSHFGSPRR